MRGNNVVKLIGCPFVLLLSDADRQQLTLTGAHPTAHVVHDAAQAAAAERRLMPPKP